MRNIFLMQKRAALAPKRAGLTHAVAVSNKPLATWSRTALMEYARDKGLNPTSRWKTETIIAKLSKG